jgi:S1-C subfamily serine protease
VAKKVERRRAAAYMQIAGVEGNSRISMSLVFARWAAAMAAAALSAFGSACAAPSKVDSLPDIERSVVRVVAVSLDINNQIRDVSFGSGFVVANERVITNQHVIQGGADAYQVRVFVIPEADIGGRPVPVVVDRPWPAADLALLRAPGLKAKPLRIALATPDKNAVIHALGYPAITDEMRQLPLEQVLSPAEPYVTPGSIALISRTAPGGAQFPTIFHTAPINPGNSGGPLVDACGRVIGVNAWEGATQMGAEGQLAAPQGQFAAVGASVLQTFLEQDNLHFETEPCVPPIDAVIDARLLSAETALAAETRARLAAEAKLTADAKRDRTILLVVGVVGVLLIAAVAFLFARLATRPRPAAVHAPALEPYNPTSEPPPS